MNTKLEEFFKKLEDVVGNLNDKKGKDYYSQGYDTAIWCIKDGIASRIDILTDIYAEETCGVEEGCEEQLSSLIKVLCECADEQTDKEFKNGFEEVVNTFIEYTKPIIEWLKSFEE